MSKRKKLSNPFSTGGGGPHFEACIQASFVTLMLTSGYAPCLPCWPIVKIKLQGKIEGFDTDDLIVTVENPNDKKQQKLLGQIKHSIKITESSSLFGEVMQAAWNDFNNPDIFTRDKDIIALITGPLNKTDNQIIWLANYARANDAGTFFRDVEKANFSSDIKREKLKVFRHHLKIANGGIEIQDNVLYAFLKHFYCLGYDLGEEEGVVLSLINSHIAQFDRQAPRRLWSRILEFTSNRNQHAGIITQTNLPDDLADAFKESQSRSIPEFLTKPQLDSTDWAKHHDATYLTLAILIGTWDENNKNDIEIVNQLFKITYDTWQQKAREILHTPDSPLSIRNGTWKVKNRVNLWKLLGSRILNHDLDTFKLIAISVLQEPDPAFELPAEERYAASIYGKILEHSHVLRKGIAEGLAILSSQSSVCNKCPRGKAENTSAMAIHEIFDNADWRLWGSLNDVLPILAEAAPDAFLNAIEKALHQTPCPFDELFAQESGGITGRNYLTGLLWALEGLAWDENYFVRVCVVLGDLAKRDPGGNWSNRPSNSLITILLPWLPQTLASIDKRKVAIETLLKEQPDVGWNLVVKLLSIRHQVSSGSRKPSWRKIIPDDWEKGVTRHEYQQQVACYAGLAVKTASYDTVKLAELIDRFNDLPNTAFDQLAEVLTSQPIFELSEEQRHLLWDHLVQFTTRHRRFADAEWALPNELVTRIENIADQLAPTNSFYLYQHLFSGRDFDLYEEKSNWEEQSKKLNAQREAAIKKLFQQEGIQGVIAFSEAVNSQDQVGRALALIEDKLIEQTLLPSFLNAKDKKHKILVGGFVWERYAIKGWDWCDNIDKSEWTPEQVGSLLICLPFTKDTWNRVSQWLEEYQEEYWVRVFPNYYQADSELDIVIEKLIEHDRAYSAINYLGAVLHVEKTVKAELCVQALRAALSCRESPHDRYGYHIVKLIKFLQSSEPLVSQEDLFKIEWAYLSLLDRYNDAAPKFLESTLANNPDFFCEAIQLIYRSNKDEQVTRENTEESTAIATNTYQLLREWKTPPGTSDGKEFNAEHFNEWLKRVKTICTESGHLEVALINIGEVLIHAPADQSGLWIHKAVAAALNDADADYMRSGFKTATFNSRGAHSVDPTGTPEKKLAEQFRRKAEDLENTGFHRFTITLKDLAKSYEQDAGRIIDENQRDG